MAMYVHYSLINVLFFIIIVMNFLYYCFRTLQGSSDRANNSNDGGPEFTHVFVIVWIGSVIVTLNSKLLGGNM